MSFFEFLGELFDPGPVGQITVERGEPQPERPPWLIGLRLAIALSLLAAFEYFAIVRPGLYDLHHVLRVNAVLGVYLGLANTLRIEPDYDNTGWVPFLINHPFRFSDNVNRFLVFLSVVVLPGRFVGRAVWEGVQFYFLS
jgi:hypothetical protein